MPQAVIDGDISQSDPEDDYEIVSDSDVSDDEDDAGAAADQATTVPLISTSRLAWSEIDLPRWVLNPGTETVFLRQSLTGDVSVGIFAGESALTARERNEWTRSIEDYLRFDSFLLDVYRQIKV